jgi:UDP-N-acetylglucosamine 2-epimerase
MKALHFNKIWKKHNDYYYQEKKGEEHHFTYKTTKNTKVHPQANFRKLKNKENIQKMNMNNDKKFMSLIFAAWFENKWIKN